MDNVIDIIVILAVGIAFIYFINMIIKMASKQDENSVGVKSISDDEILSCRPHSWMKAFEVLPDKIHQERFKQLTSREPDSYSFASKLVCRKCGYISGSDSLGIVSFKQMEQVLKKYL